MLNSTALPIGVGQIPDGISKGSGQSEEALNNWNSYLSSVKKQRKEYSLEQAHYWRARAVFKYLCCEVKIDYTDESQIEKLKKFARTAVKRTEITEYACERVPYHSTRIETWLLGECYHPENFEKGEKPWGKVENLMSRISRLKECTQALALVFLVERQRKMTGKEIFERYSSGDIGTWAKGERLDDPNTYKYRNVDKPMKNKISEEIMIRVWLRPLTPWLKTSSTNKNPSK